MLDFTPILRIKNCCFWDDAVQAVDFINNFTFLHLRNALSSHNMAFTTREVLGGAFCIISVDENFQHEDEKRHCHS